MGQELQILLVSAVSIGFIHTLFGPDHYLPFVMMARARKWSKARTLWITGLCGLGHVAGSILLGVLGITLGIALTSLETVESLRGEIAAWFLIAFGLVYFAWGIRKAYRSKAHTHGHSHEDGTTHQHIHVHTHQHAHLHDSSLKKKELTPWVLFVIFVLGPCEPLIPLLIYPAANNNWSDVWMVTAAFGIVTIATMILSVMVILYGFQKMPQKLSLERYIHAIAGATIALCGIAIQFLGL